MHLAVLGEIGRLIALLAAEAGVHHRHIHEIVFSGNTCMLHLSLAEDPASLGKFPYHFQLSGNEHRPASAFRLPAAHHALIYLPPVISAFVGPDITSGILATALHRRQGATLLVDIGTNGEMVLARDGALFATSTAAGPAFEGMNIGCGMRATNGAIEAFEVDELGRCDVKTIGGVEATGICGSGLMDIVAQLVTCGVITPSGRFCAAESAAAPGLLRDRLERRDGKVSFRVTERVTLSQKDIRQVQLAKGAIRAGIEFLLKAVGVDAASVERVLIAGSFGYHLRAESLLALGLLPGAFGGRIEFVGNTSKSGGAGFLLSRSARDEMASVVAGVEVVELTSFADFDRCFVDCLSFPERTCTSA